MKVNIQGGFGKGIGRIVKSRIGERMEKMVGVFFTFFGFVAFMIGLGFVVAYPIMRLWNGCLVPAVSFAHPITQMQAWGLMILFSFLFKSSSSSSSKKSDK